MSDTRTCPSSLLPMNSHDPALLYLLSSQISDDTLSYIAAQVVQVIKVGDPPPRIPLPSPPVTPVKGKFAAQQRQQLAQQQVALSPSLPSLDNFIQTVVTNSHVCPSTLLATLIYLHRLKHKLPRMARGMQCTRHRVFLATLVVAAKYLNDSTPKNKMWMGYSSYFDTTEINLMEKQLLDILEFDLRITESEVLEHLRPLFTTREKTRKTAVERVAKGGKERIAAAAAAAAALYLPITPPHDAIPPSKRPVGRYPSRPPVPDYSSESSDVGPLTEDMGNSSSEMDGISLQGLNSDRKRDRFVLRAVPVTAYRRRVSGPRPSQSDLLTALASPSRSPISPSPAPLDFPAIIPLRVMPRNARTGRANTISHMPAVLKDELNETLTAAVSLPTLATKTSGFFGRLLGVGRSAAGSTIASDESRAKLGHRRHNHDHRNHPA